MQRTRIEWFGLLGVVSFISYATAVSFSPLAYPDYNWMFQAVSDLSAINAPSQLLWNQLASLYGVCGIVSITLVSIYIENKLTPTIRKGIYLFALMNWFSFIGYALFPLTSQGTSGNTLQDFLHVFVVTPLVVVLSIISLSLIIYGSFKASQYRALGNWALGALILMFVGAVGTGVAPTEYFGIPERFSVFAATGFNAVLGFYLFNGFYTIKATHIRQDESLTT